MQVYMRAPIWGQSGYEVLSRGIALSLDKFGVKVQINAKNYWNKESCFLSDEEEANLDRMCANLVETNAYQIHQQFPEVSMLNSGIMKDSKKVTCFSLFETDRCPHPWVSKLNSIDRTFVFSEFNKRTYMDSGVKKVSVIPFGVDTKMFNPSVEPFKFDRGDDFVFLTNGDWTERKNFEGLIEAYVKEFTNKEKVCLVIKTHYSGFIKRFKEECSRRIKEIVMRNNSIDTPRIYFLGAKVPWYQMPKFYTAGDCFILTSRGEGLGLPYAEALASGVPVIAADFGGHMDFLNEDNSLVVHTETKVIDDMNYIGKCLWALNHSWAFPDLIDTRSKMRFAFEFRDVMKEKGRRGRADMEKKTWDKAGLDLISKLLEKEV